MYPWRFYLDYFVHFLTSNSRHGTHSPFVYRLVDEVIYAKQRPGEPKNKIKRLTARLIDRFEPDGVYELGIGRPSEPLDFVIAEEHDAETVAIQLNALWPRLHSGSVLVLSGIYRNTGKKRLWYTIKTKPEVTVTIDLFCVGVVFFHRGQAKEDFKIRY